MSIVESGRDRGRGLEASCGALRPTGTVSGFGAVAAGTHMRLAFFDPWGLLFVSATGLTPEIVIVIVVVVVIGEFR